jgi:glyoxylase-like metal-dependent hydrolase (beta-lactamase superfamily II)
MIFKQLFDQNSSTYTYIVANRIGGEALIIDPVLENSQKYINLLEEIDVKLLKAIDTHIHADHFSALPYLRDSLNCVTVMGEQSKADIVSIRVKDNDNISIDGINLKAIYTPGHTDDSYCFMMDNILFTGDTLLIRGTGRTDFQNGDPALQYESLFEKILKFPDSTLIYPGHDYKGNTVSTIYEERKFNPRLQIKNKNEYINLMNNLNLPNPKMMNLVIPKNVKIGFKQKFAEKNNLSVHHSVTLQNLSGYCFVDLRDASEIKSEGKIENSVHISYTDFIVDPIEAIEKLNNLKQNRRQVVLYCAHGERSAVILDKFSENLKNVKHLKGGFTQWKKNNN